MLKKIFDQYNALRNSIYSNVIQGQPIIMLDSDHEHDIQLSYIARENKGRGTWDLCVRLQDLSKTAYGYSRSKHHKIFEVESQEQAEQWLAEHGKDINKNAVQHLHDMGKTDLRKHYPKIFRKDI